MTTNAIGTTERPAEEKGVMVVTDMNRMIRRFEKAARLSREYFYG